jgi:hypothetical protein
MGGIKLWAASRSRSQPAPQRRRRRQRQRRLPIKHLRSTIYSAYSAELEVHTFSRQWKSSGAGDGGGAARTRTHASDGGARRQRQGGGAGGGGEAFLLLLDNIRIAPDFLYGQQTKPITSNVFSLETLGTIERRSGWQGAPSQLTTHSDLNSWGVP